MGVHKRIESVRGRQRVPRERAKHIPDRRGVRGRLCRRTFDAARRDGRSLLDRAMPGRRTESEVSRHSGRPFTYRPE